MKTTSFICLTIACLSLLGCKATSPDWDKDKDIEHNVINSPKIEERIEKAEYLARSMIGVDQRQKYVSNLMKKDVPKWDSTSTMLGFAGASVVSNPFSSSGASTAAGITMGLDVLSFFADGSADKISQIYVPKTSPSGESFTKESATTYARSQVHKALSEAFDDNGMKLTCYSNCKGDGKYRYYLIELSDTQMNKLKAKGYPFVPREIQVKTFLHELLERKINDPIESLALGFEPGFLSGYGGFNIEFGATIRRNFSDEKMEVIYSDFEGLKGYKMKHPLEKTQLGRDLLRSFTKRVPWVYSNDSNLKGKYVAFGGHVYDWNIATAYTFIEGEITN